ncbi:MAG: hypothetical protein CSA61_01205 [Neptuniibacter caesariensis]|uniref:Fimbrial assembly protein n=1 Tax=Neptuniibacter caesariensis TaxID=207954 RepID=A0A2G6JAS6_NEPCE|nr:MAG: hypothetical protein CSA61_01205 [Neptuniibacter caesariensis]
MKQRINLYNPYKPKEKFDPLSFKGALTLVSVLSVIAIAIGAGLYVFAEQKLAELAELQTKRSALESNVAEEQMRFESLQVKPEILVEKKRLKSEIQSRERLKLLLHRLQPEQSAAFSEYLYAFSEASQPESWLEKFVLNTDERRLQLDGAAANGPAVPAMLEALGQTEMFQGMSVGDLTVEALESGVKFQVAAELRRYD